TRGIRVHVGLVHARVGAHEALAGLDDEHVLGLADDAPALPQDHLHEARIATDLPRDRLGLGGHAHLRETHHAPLGLGDDLLAHHQQVARLDRRALKPRSRRALRVWGPRSSSTGRSSGASTSSPIPGSSSTRGTSPAARAAARWLANEGSPKVRVMAPGGASRAALVPRPEREGTNTTPPGRSAARSES